MLKQLLEPKDEVLSGRLQGVIDIEHVADPKRRALESRPRDFLQYRNYIPTIWKNSVQAIPRGLPIVVTSDHGYIFLGASFETTRASEAPSLLGQSRFKEFALDEPIPQWNPDLQLLPERRVALLRGRMRTRPQGANSRKLYHHGGFSLMEVLVPWIELEPRA